MTTIDVTALQELESEQAVGDELVPCHNVSCMLTWSL